VVVSWVLNVSVFGLGEIHWEYAGFVFAHKAYIMGGGSDVAQLVLLSVSLQIGGLRRQDGE
jgi:hypothetical protein